MKYVDKSKEGFEVMKISVKEFDEMTESHEFSQNYKRRKEKLIKEYDESKIKKYRRIPFRVAVAAAAVCVVGTVGVYAAVNHSDFFNNALGNGGRKSVTSHMEMQDQGDKGSVSVQMPAREYVTVDTNAAEKHLGSYMLEKPIVKKIGEHTLTILSAVRDKNAMVMEFTLERKGGENSLVYNSQTNAAKGAYFFEEGDISFWINNGDDYIYVDTKKSTEEKLYCYDYSVFGDPMEEGEVPSLCIISADGSIQQENSKINKENLEIPVKKAVPTISYASKKGGILEVSALSMDINMGKGLGLKGYEKQDPGSIKTVIVKYNDGSEYIVEDENTYNVGCSCGFGEHYTLAFNRLVEVDNIEAVEVNGIRYTMK